MQSPNSPLNSPRPCRKCGETVSRAANKCPHCGADYPAADLNIEKSIGAIVAYVFVILLTTAFLLWLVER